MDTVEADLEALQKDVNTLESTMASQIMELDRRIKGLEWVEQQLDAKFPWRVCERETDPQDLLKP